jgi:type 1 glutamine amidotransferase
MKKLILLLLATATLTACAADKKIVFLAGVPSHGPGQHEHRAGSLLLADCLTNVPGVTAVVVSNGWPTDESVFEGAAAVVFYCDGGKGHPLLKGERVKTIGALMAKGVGLACLHYGVEPTPEAGEKELLDWIGGAFSINWSVNPTWTADFAKFPEHPVARGVKPFQCYDEWYFNMRFREEKKGLTMLLSAVPPASAAERNDGPHENNPTVREQVAKGATQTMAWTVERADGGRGFGFTGGHYHKNWGDDNFRKLVLNALVWIAKAEVPAGGVTSTVTPEQLAANLDVKVSRPRPKPVAK